MMKTDSIGLYVHIPFCKKKCNYCDFCSYSDLDAETKNSYINALIAEINSYKRSDKISIDTIFFGGGTPSLLSVDEFFKITDSIYDAFDVSSDTEFTVEANPKTVTEEKIKAFKSCGVNRISLGLQSIHQNELKILGRIHTFEDFKTAYNIVLNAGIANISVDVMYGIPEQTPLSFEKTLAEVVALRPTHISSYGLILEEETPFWQIKDSLDLPSEDEEADMYFFACEFLSKRGYRHYEISNFALDTYRSRHNLKYWQNKEYIGVGVSAYSYFNGTRFGNCGSIHKYLSENAKEYVTKENIDSESEKYEFVMLALRLDDGFSLSEYSSKFNSDFFLGREQKINEYISLGYMKLSGDRLMLTDKGFYISNTILTDLL